MRAYLYIFWRGRALPERVDPDHAELQAQHRRYRSTVDKFERDKDEWRQVRGALDVMVASARGGGIMDGRDHVDE